MSLRKHLHLAMADTIEIKNNILQKLEKRHEKEATLQKKRGYSTIARLKPKPT